MYSGSRIFLCIPKDYFNSKGKFNSEYLLFRIACRTSAIWRVLSMLLAKIMHTIFDLMAMEGWVEEEICTGGVSNGQK